MIEVGERALIISPSSFSVFAYDVYTGEEIWHTTNTAYSPAVRPVFGNGLVYVATGRGSTAEVCAIHPDGAGDVTESHIVWKVGGGIVPQEPSMLFAEGLLYVVNNGGAITCLKAETGEEVWNQRLGGNCIASPIYADDNLYVCNTQGRTTVLQAGAVANVLAKNELDEGCMASPAVLGKALILRTKTHLYRIENR